MCCRTVILPYIQSASDQLKWTMRVYNIETIFRHQQNLATVFKKLKDCQKEQRIPGMVKYRDCVFTYTMSESKHSWNSRAKSTIQHERLVGNLPSVIVHIYATTHDVHLHYATILRQKNNHLRRLLLESLLSTMDTNCVNEHKPFPNSYRPLLKLKEN